MRLLLNDKAALLLSFAVPMVLILVFGTVLGGSGGGPAGVRLLLVDEAHNAASARMVAALERETAFQVIRQRNTEDGPVALTEADVRQWMLNNASAYRFGIIIPADFSTDGMAFKLRLMNNPQNTMENAMVMGLFQRAFFTELPQLMVGKLNDELTQLRGESGWQLFRHQIGHFAETVFAVDGTLATDAFDRFIDSLTDPEASLFAAEPGEGGDLLDSILQIDNEQIFGRGRNIATQSMAGFAVMFLLFGLSGAATSLFEDRNQQILHRLLAGPVTRMQILWGKYLFSVLFGCLQLVVLFVFGHLVFDVIHSPTQIPLLAVMMVAFSAAATGFSMIICAYAKTQAQASGIATLFILLMSALGGAMIPSFLFPAFLRDYITPLTLVHWGVDGFLAILWRDSSIGGILLNLAVLLAIAALTLALATPRFIRDATFTR